MFIRPEVPAHRRGDPRRQAEVQVREQLAGCPLPGVVLYEARAARNAPEIDFAIWLEGRAKIALQVKGSRYILIGRRWHLQTDAG